MNEPWHPLSPSGLQSIHDATMQILSGTGIVFHDEEARDVLGAHGADVDGRIVRIPTPMVEKAIETSPDRFELNGRGRSVSLGRGNRYYTSCFGPVRVRPLGATDTRPARLEDLRRFTVLADALDSVAYCLFHVRPADVPVGFQDLVSAAEMLKITDKHVHFSQDGSANTEALIRIGEIAGEAASPGRGPVFSLGGCPTSPLTYDAEVTQRLRMAAARQIPFLVVAGAMAGATSPVTLAGTLAAQNAEILAGVTLAQLVHPGTPIVYGTFSSSMDWRTGSFVMGGPEMGLIQAATAQLCRLYRIPFGYGSGGWTDAGEPGVQAGIEKASTLLATALAGVEVVHSAVGGMLAGAEIADYAQMMIDDELSRLVDRYAVGIEVTEEALAVDFIHEIGPGGQFVDAEHTLSHFRSEHFIPSLLERPTPGSEASDVVERATERARSILDSHTPNVLPSDAAEAIDEIVQRELEE